MATPSTACVDMVAALFSVLQTYATANPTLLRKVWTARPGSVGETPCAYIGARDETITHSAGVRTRTFTPTVVVVDLYGDNEQTSARLDNLQDDLVDAFTANPHAVAGGLTQQTGVTDADLSWDGVERITWYRARTFFFDQVIVAEGRV